MKKLFGLISILGSFISVYSQTDQIKRILSNVERDSTDKKCSKLFSDYYESFESDEGLSNHRMDSAFIRTFQYVSDPKIKNKQLVMLLNGYRESISEPKKALVWIRSLKEEYFKVYNKVHPLILLYEGESMINKGDDQDAYNHFTKFQQKFPNSVMAMVYIYKTEKNKSLSKTWLSVLKKLHPDHWVVKTLKEN
jgi:hypothetical protein